MSIAYRRLPAASGRTGAVDVTQAELDFHDRAETTHWWEVKHDPTELAETSPYLLDRKAGTKLVPIIAGEALPLIVTPSTASPGGVNNAPYVEGRSADPAGRLISEAGAAVIPLSGDFTLWSVAKGGSSAQSALWSVVGDDGAALRGAQRSSDLFNVLEYDAATTGTQRLAVACSTAAYHLVEFSYQASSKTMAVRVDGGALSTIATTWSPKTARLAVLAAHDLVDGRLGGSDGRGIQVAAIGVAATYAPNNADWRAALKALVAALYPAIVVA